VQRLVRLVVAGQLLRRLAVRLGGGRARGGRDVHVLAALVELLAQRRLLGAQRADLLLRLRQRFLELAQVARRRRRVGGRAGTRGGVGRLPLEGGDLTLEP